MIKYVYTTRNKLSGNFNSPLLYDIPKENAAEAFAISAKESKDPLVAELEAYYLGTYDTKTGLFVNEQEFLISILLYSVSKSF